MFALFKYLRTGLVQAAWTPWQNGQGGPGSRHLDSAPQASPLNLLLPAMAVLAVCWLGQVVLLW